MNNRRDSGNTRHARVLAAGMALSAAAACLPAAAWAGPWAHDATYGDVTVVALPGGQATLARDGADLQARTIAYTPAYGAASTISRAYGPSAHKVIEIDDDTVRHHVYGAGLAPVMRMESDSSNTYQLGLDTISLPASGTATAVHRVVDFKGSTVAVLDAGATQQRVSYTASGTMRMEQDVGSACTNAVLLAGYEGLQAWLLGSDQLVDNRARLYHPVSGRFLALDQAGQATAYEARANNPVSRDDADGHLNFDQLINALREDPSIRIAFGEDHDSLEAIYGVVYLALRLAVEHIPFVIFQESNLMTAGPAEGKVRATRLDGTGMVQQVNYLLDKGLIIDLDTGPTVMKAEQEAHFRASYPSKRPKEGYGLFKGEFGQWEQNIPQFLARMEKEKAVPIFLFGANHLKKFEDGFHQYPMIIYDNHLVVEVGESVALVPMSSFGLQSRFNLLTVMTTVFSRIYAQQEHALTTTEFLVRNDMLSFQVVIPDQLFAEHPALKKQYNSELFYRDMNKKNFMPNFLMSSVPENNEMEEKDENDEKNGESNPGLHSAVSVQPVKKPKEGFSFDAKFDKK